MSRCAWARPSSTTITGCGGRRVGQFTSGASLTFEDNVNSIKRRLWLDTDRAYRAAAERLIRIKTNTQVKVAEEDDSDDFSTEPPAVVRQTPPKLKFDEAEWSGRIRKLSARFENYPSVLTSHVSVLCQTDTRYFVNTEGLAHRARARLRAGGDHGFGQSRRRHRPERLRDIRSGGPGRASRRQSDPGGHRPRGQRRLGAAARARSRAVRRPGDFFRPRRGRVLPRDLRPPRGRAPAEGRKRRPDVHQERGHQGSAGLSLGGVRPHAPQDRRAWI